MIALPWEDEVFFFSHPSKSYITYQRMILKGLQELLHHLESNYLTLAVKLIQTLMGS